MRRLLLLLALLAGPALACDYTLGPCVSNYVAEEVPPYSIEFKWLQVFRQINNAAAGENVALTSRMDKRGPGNSWAFVAEEHCDHPRNGCHGVEVDLVLNGSLQWGDWRVGQSIVLWGSGVANHALLLGNWFEDKATVERGITVDLRCSIDCIQVPADQKICMDRDGHVCFRLNSYTRRVELLAGERVIVAWPVD